MMNSENNKIEDTEENHNKCLCRRCQNYKRYSLEKFQPTDLFCVHGKSSAAGMREIGCFCPACELFNKHHLRGGYFCVRR